MKRMICLFLAVVMLMCSASCGNSAATPTATAETVSTETVKETTTRKETSEAPSSSETTAEAVAVTTEEVIENADWDKLEALGKIETENGIRYVYITVPSDYVGENVTQEDLDEDKNDVYTSATLNEDGSVTYKLTRKQHKAMLDEMSSSIEASIDDMVKDESNTFTRIEHNADFTVFDAHISTSELGLTESFSVLVFYIYGGMYGIFAGTSDSDITVNFYDADGKIINTSNSSDMGSAE